MKKAFQLGLVLLTAPFFAMAAVDPALLSLVMPDAKIVAGVQLQQAQASGLGQFLLSQMQNAVPFDNLAQATGFDPRRDLQEIVAASGNGKTGFIVGRGVFQPQRISNMAAAAGASVSSYNGTDLLVGRGAPNGLAFLDASTVVLGDVASLKAAIDRRAGGAQLSAALKQKALDTSARNDAWIVSVTPIADLLAAAGAGANMQQVNLLQTVQQLALGLKFGASTVKLTGEAMTRTNEDAQALADVLRFLASMAQANAKGPDAARASALVDAAKFSAEGTVMRLTLELPETQVEEMFQPARQKRAAAR